MIVQVKVVSLHCTWAGLIRAGAITGKTYKQHETRSKSNAIGKDYRGWVALASTSNPDQPDWDVIKQIAALAPDAKEVLRDFDLYAPGHIVALARVTDAFELTPEIIAAQSPLELATGDWQPGRWAFRLEDTLFIPCALPYKAKGQGAPYVPPDSEIGKQLTDIINGSTALTVDPERTCTELRRSSRRVNTNSGSTPQKEATQNASLDMLKPEVECEVWDYLEPLLGQARLEAIVLTHDTETLEHINAIAVAFPLEEQETLLPHIRETFVELYYSSDVQDLLEKLPQFKVGDRVKWIKDKVENPLSKVVELSGCAVRTDASPMYFLSSCFELAGGTITVSAEVLGRVEEENTVSGEENESILKWEAYGYTWNFDPANKVIQCLELWWELEKFSLCFDDFTGGDFTQISPNQSPQSWLDDWMISYPDHFSNVLFSNDKFAGNPVESSQKEAQAPSRTQTVANLVEDAAASLIANDKIRPEERSANQQKAINRFLERLTDADSTLSAVEGQASSLQADTDSALDAEDSSPREEWINPDLILLDAGTQSRPNEDRDKIDDYKQAMMNGDWDMERRPLPEIMLCPDGRYYPIDCHHRVKAAIASLHPGRLMLFLVRQGTLAHARVLSAAANTFNGLGVDNSPHGVRLRIEIFLDNIEELSPEVYAEEFLKTPSLTKKELGHGKFSDRTIARYLRLRENQYKTVGNIIRERALAGKISQFQVGDRIEVVFPSEIESDKRPRGFVEGEAGTIHSKDKKVGLWVKWDKLPPSSAPFPINPDFVRPSDKPKPERKYEPSAQGQPNTISPSTRTKVSAPASISGSSPSSGSITFTGVAKNARVLPDVGRNEDATALTNPTPSLHDATSVFKEWDKVQVCDPDCWLDGKVGDIRSFPSNGYALVSFVVSGTHRLPLEALKPFTQTSSQEVNTSTSLGVEAERSRSFNESSQHLTKEADFVSALNIVVDNLHRLSTEELKALEDAIACAKRRWTEEVA